MNAERFDILFTVFAAVLSAPAVFAGVVVWAHLLGVL